MDDPIELLAGVIARKVVLWNQKITAHPEDIRFGAAYYINYYSVIIITLAVGIFSKSFLDTAMSLIAFGILRHFTGGFHFSSLTICAIVTISLLSLIPHIPINREISLFCNLSAFAIITLANRGLPNGKRIALMLVGSNFLCLSSVISLAFLAQSLTTIKKRG